MKCLQKKKKERGVFYILLYVFLHFRRKFGEPFSALGTRTGNSVCLVACRHYCSNVNDSVASASFSKSLKSRRNALRGQGMLGWAGLCCSVVQGEICGVPRSQLSCGAPTWSAGNWAWKEVVLCGWRKDNAVLMSIVNSSLWLGGGILSFTRAATDKFDIGN